MISKSIIERLALVKYLYRLGAEQSQLPEPKSAIAVLAFHDAVELFLGIACEKAGTTREKDYAFMDYWGVLRKEFDGKAPTHQHAMKRLNKARVGVKHYGIRPSASEINDFGVLVTDFFEENTPLIFGFEFSDISLVSLVEYQKTREYLISAESNIRASKTKEALTDLALAFACLLVDFERRNTDYKDITQTLLPNFGYADALYTSGFNPRYTDTGLNVTELEAHTEAEKNFGIINSSLNAISYALVFLILGLDYRKYTKFRYLTIGIVISRDDNNDLVASKGGFADTRKADATEEELDFCLDFVIESALKLQTASLE